MARYEYRCANGHRHERDFDMGDAVGELPCCEYNAVRVFGNFQFSEDRCRQFRNPQDGSRFSYALGMEYPQSRGERDKVFAALNCEPVTRGTMPEAWKRDQEYHEHTKHGGARDFAFERAQCGSRAGSTTVLSQLRESNVKIP